MDVLIRPDADAASAYVAMIIARELRRNPHLVMGLATGRTMESVYAKLVRTHRDEGLDFSACQTFNLDEYVGLDGAHCDSYRHYMNRHLFEQVNVNMSNTHLPIGVAPDLDAECADYEKLISRCDGIDLQLLGIGNNGHLGFNEPLSAFDSRTRVCELSQETLQQNARLFGQPDQMPHRAITMGMKTILDSRQCVLLATGEGKADIVAKALESPVTNSIPASALQLHPHCTVVLDQPASSRLKAAGRYERAFENQKE